VHAEAISLANAGRGCGMSVGGGVRGVGCLDEDEVIEVNRGYWSQRRTAGLEARGVRNHEGIAGIIRECINFRAMFWIKRLDS
jgi:hypothetical protein